MPTTITGEDARQLAQIRTKGRWSAGPQRYLGTWDTRLYVPTVPELRGLSTQVFELFNSLRQTDRGEAFDCEDYSLAFAGMVRAFAAKMLPSRFSIAVGIAMGHFSWSGDARHVCNWCLVRASPTASEATFTYLEPQVNPDTQPHWFRDFSTASQLEVMII